MPWLSNRERRRGRFFSTEVMVAIVAIVVAVGFAALVLALLSNTNVDDSAFPR